MPAEGLMLTASKHNFTQFHTIKNTGRSPFDLHGIWYTCLAGTELTASHLFTQNQSFLQSVMIKKKKKGGVQVLHSPFARKSNSS